MTRALRIAGQALVYGVLMALLGTFSAWPRYSPLAPGTGLLLVSFSHAGARIAPCRRFTPEEIAAMAPNMRRSADCPRERVALRLELEVDGAPALARELPPSGLAGDGASTVYARVPLAAGRHRLVARLRDSRREQGFDHVRRFELDLAPGESRLLGFRAEGGFRLR